jgi:hypothetical protein
MKFQREMGGWQETAAESPIEKIPHPAKSLEQAQEWGQRLADWLGARTGVEWKVRAHENLGFFYSVTHGSISVSQSQYSYDLGRFLVMNGGTHCVGVGHASMRSFHAEDGQDLLESIELSIRDVERELKNWTKVLESNSGISRISKVSEPKRKNKW